MLPYVTGVAGLAALYWMPGWLFLRCTGLGIATRAVIAAAITYPVTTAGIVVLSGTGLMNRLTLAVLLVALLVAAVAMPASPGAFNVENTLSLRLPLTAAAISGAVLAVKSLQPAKFRIFDAIALWGPFARSFAEDGELWPDWVPTLLVGFGRSVGLVAGSVSMLAGGFDPAHALFVHPVFAGLLLATVVLLGGHLAGRPGAWVALLVMLSSQLMWRGMLFHDDLVAAFFAAAAVLMALRAESWQGWLLVGIAASGAFAMKLLGAVALALVVTVLFARLPRPSAWLAVGAGWLAAAPWYLANTIKFGNPIYPLAASFFGESDQLRILDADHTQYLKNVGVSRFWELGVLTAALVAVGGAIVLWKTVTSRDAAAIRWIGALMLLVSLFLLAWQGSGRASRHLASVLPVAAAVASVGLVARPLVLRASTEPLDERELADARRGLSASAVAVFVLLAAVTTWNVQQDFYAGNPVQREWRTGIYAMLIGKWANLRLAADPPLDRFAVHGTVGAAWEELIDRDPELGVFSFDNRTYFIPQEVIPADDLRAFAVYDAPDPEARHAALARLGVGYVLDWRTFGPEHPIYEMGPWLDLDAHSDLYRNIMTRRGYALYEVVPRGE